MPNGRAIKATLTVVPLLLVTAGLTGCGQVMERIQGTSGEKPGSTAVSSPAEPPSAGQAQAQQAPPATGLDAGPSRAVAATPRLDPIPTPPALPTATEPQAVTRPAVDVHRAPQETSSTTKVYRSSDARRP